jgi:hypothetical protein
VGPASDLAGFYGQLIGFWKLALGPRARFRPAAGLHQGRGAPRPKAWSGRPHARSAAAPASRRNAVLARWLALVLLAGPWGSEALPAASRANPWAAWVTGSWVLFDVENTLGERSTSKHSLVAVGETTYTLRTESTRGEKVLANQSVVSLAALGYPHALPSGQALARETLTIEGRQFECQVWRARYAEGGEQWDAIAWVADGTDHPLRIKLKGPVELELEVVALEDYVTIARRKFRCMHYAGQITSDGRRTALEQWRSSDVPGALVRLVTSSEIQGVRVVQTSELREFRGERLR